MFEITAVHNKMITHRCHTILHTTSAFRCLIPSADLVVIQFILFTVRHRRKIRHHHIASRQHSLFTSCSFYSAQSRCCRRSTFGNMTLNGKKINRQIIAAFLLHGQTAFHDAAETVRYRSSPAADHAGKIKSSATFKCLPGAHHKTCAYLIAQLLECIKTFLAISQDISSGCNFR